MKALLVIVALVAVGLSGLAEAIKQPKAAHLESGHPALLKIRETLSASSTRHGLPAILEDPEYNMVSLDGHHVGYVAENRLYFHQIPHQRMVLHHQDIRQMNGVHRHLLESIRPFFPFYTEY